MSWMDFFARAGGRRRLAAALVIDVLTAGAAFAGCSDRPGTPTDIKVASQQGQILISWRDTTKKGEGSCHDIEIKRKSDGDASKSVTGGLCLSGGTTGSTLVTGLPYGQEYCVRLKARDRAGTQGCVSQNWSATVCGTSAYPPFSTSTGPKGPAPIEYTIDRDIDRPGSDIDQIQLRTFGRRDDTRPCQSACDKNSRCKGWTYARTRGGGLRGFAVCYLKSPLPAPVKNPCCISGFKRDIIVK